MRRTQKNLWYLKMQRRAFQNKQPKVFVYLQEMYIMVFHVTDNLSFSYTPPNFCLVVYFFFFTHFKQLTKQVYETTLYYLVSLCIYLVGTFYLPSILSSPLPFLYWNFCRKLPWWQHSQHFSFVLPRIEIVLCGNTNANEVLTTPSYSNAYKIFWVVYAVEKNESTTSMGICTLFLVWTRKVITKAKNCL